MDGRQLTRSETDRRIAGVCGGLADYFDVDPILVRVIFVIAALMGPGILVYGVLWLVMPRGAAAPAGSAARPSGRRSSAVRIAEERYAMGEISAEEFTRIRADLMGEP